MAILELFGASQRFHTWTRPIRCRSSPGPGSITREVSDNFREFYDREAIDYDPDMDFTRPKSVTTGAEDAEDGASPCERAAVSKPAITHPKPAEEAANGHRQRRRLTARRLRGSSSSENSTTARSIAGVSITAETTPRWFIVFPPSR